MKNYDWSLMTAADALKKLGSAEAGLSLSEALRRQKRWGLNVLPNAARLTALKLFLGQFLNPLVFVLVAGAGFTLAVGDLIDFYVIVGAFLMNVGIGFFQEHQASRAFIKLQSYVEHRARVIRSGLESIGSSRDLVPGDIIEVRAGERVPADVRVIRAREFKVDESSLTGEWLPVAKTSLPLKITGPLGDLKNLLFAGTVATEGSAFGVVYATGAATEFGQIAKILKQTRPSKTPLEIQVAKLSGFLVRLVVVISAVLVWIGYTEGLPITAVLITTAALAVATIPEGLPAAMSVVLVVSARRLLRAKGLVR